MATDYGDLKQRVLYMLEDPAGDGVTEEQLLGACYAALDAVLPWYPKAASTSLIGDGSSRSFDLPVDFYEVEAVVLDETGLILPKAVFIPGQYIGENIQQDNDWILFPSGKISFSKPIDGGATYTLYYSAIWGKPPTTNPDGTALETPDFLLTGLTFYMAAYLNAPGASSTASVRRFATRVDSGNPEHNPMQKAVVFLMTLFQQEMNRLPKRTRGVT